MGIFVRAILFVGCSIVLKSGIAFRFEGDEECAKLDSKSTADSAADIDRR